jgi:hypothetical protein
MVPITLIETMTSRTFSIPFPGLSGCMGLSNPGSETVKHGSDGATARFGNDEADTAASPFHGSMSRARSTTETMEHGGNDESLPDKSCSRATVEFCRDGVTQPMSGNLASVCAPVVSMGHRMECAE